LVSSRQTNIKIFRFVRFSLIAIGILTITTVHESLGGCIPVWHELSYRYELLYIHCENVILSTSFSTQFASAVYRIECLRINNTRSPEISTGAFATLRNLEDLRINNASIRVIQPGAFDGVSSLRKLSLKHNKISIIGANTFDNLFRLEELDLSFNNIEHVNEKVFVVFQRLNTLILQNNFVVNLSPKIFQPLRYLQILDLSFNKLVNTDSHLFGYLRNLETLLLNDNNLNRFYGSTVVNITRLKKLYINNNNLSELNNLSFPNSSLTLNASHNLIQSLSFSKLSDMKVIDLSANGIMIMKRISFKNVAVKELYLDQNYLGINSFGSETFSNLQGLELLSLSNNQITQLDPNLFKNNNKLKTLNLAKNNLRSSNLLNLPVSLNKLNLNSNFFDSRLNVTNLINLKRLDLTFNNLKQVSLHLLSNLKSLLWLDLSNNQITKLDYGCFKDLKATIGLNLSKNRISSLPLGIFVGLDYLNYLDLSRNQLKTLEEGVFHNLRRLKELNLNYNSVSLENVQNIVEHLTSTLKQIGLTGNGWSCSDLTRFVRENREVFLTNGGHFNGTNVDGIECKYETKNSTGLLNLESNSFSSINSTFYTNNILLALIFVMLLIWLSVKYLSRYFNKKNDKRCSRRESEHVLQIFEDS
jgi:Leucine-rich repeat (LRR) protein